jgi:hypothetical protein
MMRPSRRFQDPAHKDAAALICGALTAAMHTQDQTDQISDLMDQIGTEPEHSATSLEILLAATILLSKIAHDTQFLFGIPWQQTVERLSLWVATDEIADMTGDEP